MRMRMNTNYLGIMLSLGLLTALAACGSESGGGGSAGGGQGGNGSGGNGQGGQIACTEIGCNDQLRVDFDKSIARDYTVTVEVNMQTGTADCSAATFPDTTQPALANLTGAVMGSVMCEATGVTLMIAPATAKLSIASTDGKTTGEITATPAYMDVAPNGPGCPPVCKQATETMTVMVAP